MFTMKAFKYVIQLCSSVLMVIIVIPVFSYIYSGGIPFPGVLCDMLFGFIIANVIGLLIPVQPLADKFAKQFHAKNGTFVYTLLTTIVYSLFYVIFFGLLYTALAIGFPPNYLQVVIKGIPLGFAVSYVISLAVSPIALKLSLWICSKDSKKNDKKDKSKQFKENPMLCSCGTENSENAKNCAGCGEILKTP